MSRDAAARTGSLAALLVTAVVTGAFAGLVGASFMWSIDELIQLIWLDLSDALGVDEPLNSWYLFAIPMIGGLLMGLGQRYIGNYPEPIEEVIARWRAGGEVDPRTVPRSAINSFTAIVLGGPLGFEAALTGILGGVATLVGRWIDRVGRLVRQVWGAERLDDVPHVVRQVPYWLAALSGVITWRSLPFGGIGVDFRFSAFEGELTVVDALVGVVFAAVIAVPVSWAIEVASRAERATLYRRSPVIAGVIGGLLFATMALGNEYVLFSGQQGIQNLDTQSNAELLYLTVAKWVALCLAFLAGWRGGPIFPLFLSVAALGTVFDGFLDVPAEIVVVAGLAGVSAAVFRGRIVAAFVLTLYVAPLSYAAVILIGAVGAAIALALARSVGVLPPAPEVPGVSDGAEGPAPDATS